MKQKKTKKIEKKPAENKIASAGSGKKNIVSTRGRIFEGFVKKTFPKRVVIEFERTAYIPKYERFYKKTTRIHAHLPDGIDVKTGDLVRVQECRPLSKLIHHLVIGKVRSSHGMEQEKVQDKDKGKNLEKTNEVKGK